MHCVKAVLSLGLLICSALAQAHTTNAPAKINLCEALSGQIADSGTAPDKLKSSLSSLFAHASNWNEAEQFAYFELFVQQSSRLSKNHILQIVAAMVRDRGWRKFESVYLHIFEVFLSANPVHDALIKDGKFTTYDLEQWALGRGGDDGYWSRLLSLLKKYSPPEWDVLEQKIRNNFLPDTTPNVVSPILLKDPDVLKAQVDRSEALAEAQKILGSNYRLPPAAFSRRIFSLMGRHTALSQNQKYNLFKNLLNLFREMKGSFLIDEDESRGNDGARIIHGGSSSFFFVFGPDAQGAGFYHGLIPDDAPGYFHTYYEWATLREALPAGFLAIQAALKTDNAQALGGALEEFIKDENAAEVSLSIKQRVVEMVAAHSALLTLPTIKKLFGEMLLSSTWQGDQKIMLVMLQAVMEPGPLRALLENKHQWEQMISDILNAGRFEEFLLPARRYLLEKGSAMEGFLALVNERLLPDTAPYKALVEWLMPPDDFNKLPLARRLSKEIFNIFGPQDLVRKALVPRRLVAFLRRNLELTQRQKINLVHNLISLYSTHGGSFKMGEKTHSDGTVFLLSNSHADNFFAVTPDADGAQVFYGARRNANSSLFASPWKKMDGFLTRLTRFDPRAQQQ